MTKVLHFTNIQMVKLANNLSNFEMVGKASRGRSKLQKAAMAKAQEFNDDREEIRLPYFEKGDDGKPVIVNNNEFVFIDPSKKQELEDKLKDLDEEVNGIEFVEYSEKLEAFYKALEAYNKPLQGQMAEVYDDILDELEQAFSKQEKEGK